MAGNRTQQLNSEGHQSLLQSYAIPQPYIIQLMREGYLVKFHKKKNNNSYL